MTMVELKRKGDEYREAAGRATGSDREALLKVARRYYEDAGAYSWAKWCERWMEG